MATSSNEPASQGLQMFRYDALGIQGQPRNGTLYFYNNTVVNYADASVRYYTQIFQLPSHAEVLQWNVHDVLDCRNNMFVTLPFTSDGTATAASLLASDDSTVNYGTNWASPKTQLISLPYGATNFYGSLTGTNQIIYGDQNHLNNPGFVSVAATNFHLLSSSPAIDAAGPQSPNVLASTNNVIYEYVNPANSQLRAINGLGLDLGAFEGTSTNVPATLYSLTVTNGFGGGNYPSGATVPVSANPAPAGQAFAGWAGFTVANASSIGTTLTMPSSNIALTATFTNVPVPVYFPLTVVNGTGSGSYQPLAVVTITANAPPGGETFTGWTGYPVANSSAASTTLIMPAGSVTVMANYQVATNFNLTVVNGTGGGVYSPGAVVNLTAVTPLTGDIFSGWTGFAVANYSATNTTLAMPAADVVITANFQPSNGFPSTIPFPVASHPRLWITTNDLPRLQSWASPTNPVYAALCTLLTNSMTAYDTQYFPGGVQNTNWPDVGDAQGYTGLISEEDAFIFALFSLVSPNATQRPIYAQRAANLIRVAMTQAAQGSLSGAPFRDPQFPAYNRANATLETMPLAVDWIYNATGTNGLPVFSAADKLNIRNGFLTWAEQCRHASTAGWRCPARQRREQSRKIVSQQLGLPHGRQQLLSQSRAIVDPDVDGNRSRRRPAAQPQPARVRADQFIALLYFHRDGRVVVPGIRDVRGRRAVAQDYGLPGYGTNFGCCNGGMPPEGMLYGHSLGFLLSQLLALQTAGFNNTNFSGAPSVDRRAGMEPLLRRLVERPHARPDGDRKLPAGGLSNDGLRRPVAALLDTGFFRDVFRTRPARPGNRRDQPRRQNKKSWLAVDAPGKAVTTTCSTARQHRLGRLIFEKPALRPLFPHAQSRHAGPARRPAPCPAHAFLRCSPKTFLVGQSD